MNGKNTIACPPSTSTSTISSTSTNAIAMYISTALSVTSSYSVPPLSFRQRAWYDGSLYLEYVPTAYARRGCISASARSWLLCVRDNQKTQDDGMEAGKLTAVAVSLIKKLVEDQGLLPEYVTSLTFQLNLLTGKPDVLKNILALALKWKTPAADFLEHNIDWETVLERFCEHYATLVEEFDEFHDALNSAEDDLEKRGEVEDPKYNNCPLAVIRSLRDFPATIQLSVQKVVVALGADHKVIVENLKSTLEFVDTWKQCGSDALLRFGENADDKFKKKALEGKILPGLLCAEVVSCTPPPKATMSVLAISNGHIKLINANGEITVIILLEAYLGWDLKGDTLNIYGKTVTIKCYAKDRTDRARFKRLAVRGLQTRTHLPVTPSLPAATSTESPQQKAARAAREAVSGFFVTAQSTITRGARTARKYSVGSSTFGSGSPLKGTPTSKVELCALQNDVILMRDIHLKTMGQLGILRQLHEQAQQKAQDETRRRAVVDMAMVKVMQERDDLKKTVKVCEEQQLEIEDMKDRLSEIHAAFVAMEGGDDGVNMETVCGKLFGQSAAVSSKLSSVEFPSFDKDDEEDVAKPPAPKERTAKKRVTKNCAQHTDMVPNQAAFAGEGEGGEDEAISSVKERLGEFLDPDSGGQGEKRKVFSAHVQTLVELLGNLDGVVHGHDIPRKKRRAFWKEVNAYRKGMEIKNKADKKKGFSGSSSRHFAKKLREIVPEKV
eukprot:TRINITY_DN14_c0_g1_i2.p1 TRINITY_DN14_c0_g1~~TRINITY_DN14_c0_g1_i2.p1  ORF type:complete len:725 (-),score=174.26 TRINITY_DN14_c0_g1_i2:165-2339(-)